KITALQERFLSTDLTIAEVDTVLDNCVRYEALRLHISTSSALIERILPVLKANGFKTDDATSAASVQDPKPTLGEFISQTANYALANLSLPPPPLPSMNWTRTELLKQLDEGLLSEGQT